jgi:hypothetical protein
VFVLDHGGGGGGDLKELKAITLKNFRTFFLLPGKDSFVFFNFLAPS